MVKSRYAIILLAFILLGCSPRITNRNATGKTIVCFGDSITQGVGADPGAEYPAVLNGKVRWPVINAGVAGDTTADALARMDADVLAHEPRMVIVILGGNDFLRKVPKAETFANMEKIIAGIQARGAMAVIAVVKISLVGDVYTKEFNRVTRQTGAVFVPDVMKGILTNPRLKYDQIHPNSDGYQLIADRIHKAIAPLLKEKDTALNGRENISVLQ